MAHRLHDAGQHPNLIFRYCNQQCESGSDLKQARDHAADGDGSGQSTIGVTNLISHDRSQLQPYKAEANHSKGGDEAKIAGNPEVTSGHGCPKAMSDDDAQSNQGGRGYSGADAAQVVDPLAYSQAEHVEDDQEYEQNQRSAKCKYWLVRQTLSTFPRNEDRNTDKIQQHCGHVKNIVGPVTPTGHESVEVSEKSFCPQVNATLAGITMCQFDDGDTLRPEKQKQCQNPQPDGNGSIGGDGRNHIEVDHRHYEQQNQVPAAEHALQMRLVDLTL